MAVTVTRDDTGRTIRTTESGELAYRMDAANFHVLTSKLDELNRKATKLKVEPVTYEVVEREVATVSEPIIGEAFDGATVIIGSKPVRKTFYTVVVRGGFPHLDGWHFVGVIEPTDAGNIIKAMPGETVPEQYREATNYCDHCKSSRYRLSTFIVRHDDGRTAQVGRNCLAAYLGSDRSPANLAAAAEFGGLVRELGADEDREESAGGFRQREYIDTIEYLSNVASLAHCFGFVTSTQARNGGGNATGHFAWNVLTWHRAHKEAVEKGWEGVTERDIETAEAARAWAQGLDDSSDFNRNMRIVATLDAVDQRQCGIAAYIIEGYRRQQEREIEQRVKDAAPKVESHHVGTVGQRETFTDLTVSRVHEFGTDYGVMYLVRMLDPQGNVIVWKSGTDAAADLEADQTISIRCTVKEHSVYRDTPQTIVSRASVL